jgi:AraC family transcriptional regulator
LDDSKVLAAEGHDYTGAVLPHRRFDGAHVVRVMHPPGQRIDAHGHDWPVLTLYRIGDYREQSEDGEACFDGPSIVFQPPGAAHADKIGAQGLETLAMTFDPAWFGRTLLPVRTCWRHGGALGAASRRLAQAWLSADEARVRDETQSLLLALRAPAPAPPRPSWAVRVTQAMEREAPTTTIADALSLHPAWLARAYRAWRGEGIGETLRRKRVERATLRLRQGDESLAEIAAACDFADQSHMNRAFRAVLGRTPGEVRREAALVAPLAQRP